MALTREDVRKVALLARLELEDQELDRQMLHINQLLQRFEELQNVDVAGIEPAAHRAPLHNVLREDLAGPSLAREDALANAPQTSDGCIVVPRILED